MIAADRLYDLCAAVLTAVEVHYTAQAVELPARRYVANGDQQVAFDCEQITVAHQFTRAQAGDVTLGAASPFMRDPAHTMKAATVAITVVRCAPSPTVSIGTVQVPSVADEQASARRMYADGQLVENAVLAAQKAGQLGSCNSVGFVDLLTPGTGGKFASVKVRLLLGLE